MKLSEVKSKFEKGIISKHDFIDEMYKSHTHLFDYVNLLKGNGISKIEISNQSIVMSMKPVLGDGEIKLNCITNDKRTTVLEILNFGTYEQDDALFLFKLAESDFTVFDVGANIGWYSLNFSKIIKNGIIFSFEPIPVTLENLRENLLLNNVSNIKLFNIALSNTNGEVDFYFNPDELGASSARNIKELDQINKVKCRTQTLDSFCIENEITKLDLIKCDVEGGEFFVFEGGLDTIKKYQPIVFTEMLRKWSAKFDYHPNKIIKYFSDLDYKCFIVNKNTIIEIKEVNDDTVETNFIFLHPVKHAEKIKKYS